MVNLIVYKLIYLTSEFLKVLKDKKITETIETQKVKLKLENMWWVFLIGPTMALSYHIWNLLLKLGGQ